MDAREFKPKWDDAPEWAEYLAMDNNGMWWWHEERPAQNDDCWVSDGDDELAGYFVEFKKFFNWEETLEARPK